VDIIDTELLDVFDEYRGYGINPIERVRLILMKRRSGVSNGTKFMSKFTHKLDSIFQGLPKSKEWISFATAFL